MIKQLLQLSCLLVLFTAFPANAVELPQTGQTTSYSAGDDGALQIGKAWPTPRFIDNRNGTVNDNLSGLVWSGDANPLAARFAKGECTWQQAQDEIKRLNKVVYLGFNDWRLPNLNELASLVNQGEPVQSTWLNRNLFVNTAAALYWSSSSFTRDASRAWTVDLDGGSVGIIPKSASANVWLVRGTSSLLPATGQTVCYNTAGLPIECSGTGQDGELQTGVAWPAVRFSDNGNGTILDNLTGLIWPQNANTALDAQLARASGGGTLWNDALDFIAGLNTKTYLGYSDWRLPNRNELISLVNYTESTPGVQLNKAGVGGLQERYWSSGSSAAHPSDAWNITMNGEVAALNKYDFQLGSYIWPVRNNVATLPLSLASSGVQAKSVASQTVMAAVAALSVTTSTLPAGSVGTAYSQTLAATGGTTPYTWTKTTGSLPAGLTLSTAGVISGTPTTAATSTFTVQVKDKSAKTATKSLSITVNAGVLAISTTALADGYLTTAYSQTLAASGGKTAYNWSITAGTLPAGLTLAATTGVISGTPSTSGTSSITVQVKDANNTIATKALTVNVYALPSIITTSLPAGTIGVAYSQTFSAAGGKAPTTWAVSSGTLPAGLTLNATSGVISGTPTTAVTSSVTFKVTDANAKTATKALSITINAAPLSITTASLVDGYLTTAYSQTLAATGGKTAYTWSLASGTLPSGLTLAASTGVISGTPTAATSNSITIQVKDANNTMSTKALTISVYALPAISTASLPAGGVGTAYNQALTATGGKASLVWSIASGTLPAGLALNTSSGAITGTPTATGTSSVTFKVTDANAKTATKSLSITVSTTPPSITTTTLSDGVVSVTYSQTLSATGGKTPYAWTRTAGTLPAGLTLSSAGVFSGKPTTAGSYNFTVQVKDANNAIATRNLVLTIAPPLGIATTWLPEGSVGCAYSQAFAASGGKAQYTWSISSGALPVGLILDASSGVVSGTPTVSGWSDFTIQVKDANNSSASVPLSVYINPPLVILSTTLSSNFIGMPYYQPLAASGGTPPYIWSIIGGDLPAGLVLDPANGKIIGTPSVAGTSNFSVQVKDAGNVTVTTQLSIAINSFGSISGIVTDQASGVPLTGVAVTIQLDYTSSNPNDRIYDCNNVPITSADYLKITSNDGIKYPCGTNSGNNTMLFKIRNPVSVADPFSIKWNGIGTLWEYITEYLAQSFKPTRSGNLNKVSFYIPDALSTYLEGNVHVLLKSRLGGDRGTYLAKSNDISIGGVRGKTPTWVDFTFPSPVELEAGQEYYLEINGTFFEWYGGGAGLYALVWGGADSYADGGAYQRTVGIWTPRLSSLAFRTYLDNQTDLVFDPSSSSWTSMYGGNIVNVNAAVYNQSLGRSDRALYFPLNSSDSDGYYRYNGDDLSGELTVDDTPASYYDSNGWLRVEVSSYQTTWPSNLTTDYFDIIFHRRYSAVTDANGAYSFTNLPDGSYTITMAKTAYEPMTTNGTLAPGQTLNLTSPISRLQPATLQGVITSSSNHSPVPTATVTVTDLLGMHTAQSNSQGNYKIEGIVPGAYTVSVEPPSLLQPITLSGTLSSGQTGTMNITLTPQPLTLAVASPTNGSLVYNNPVTITGNATNADSVTIVMNSFNSEVGITYPASIINGTYSATVPIEGGQTWIQVGASNKYGASAGKSITVTRAAFTIKNLGDTGNVTVMEVSGDYNAKNPDGTPNDAPRMALAREYIRTHEDSFDFLVYLSTFDYAMREASASGFYSEVKNGTAGIGIGIGDNGANYGSSGTLQGTIDLGNVSSLAAKPLGSKLDETVNMFAHEIGHRWLANALFKNPDGTANASMLGKDGSHWSYLLDTKGSLLYGNGWKDNGNGTFTSTSARSSYSPLDLYLMGMINKEQVPPMLLIDNPAIDKTQMPTLGATITGTAKTVTIDDIISAIGARVPDSTTSQKQFKVGFVLLSRAGDNATAGTQAIETLRKAGAGKFAELTQGKGAFANIPAALELHLDSPLDGLDGTNVTGPDISISGLVINTSGAKTTVTINGIAVTVSGGRFVVSAFPLQQGLNTLEIKATDVNGLTATTTRSITSATGYDIGSVPGLIVGVATPSSGATIIGPDVNVSGIVINSSGTETGVTVNGLPATVNGNNFIANHVPLQLGSNTLTITATDANGLTATTTRSVIATPGHYIRITSNIDSGTGPLNISLRLDGSFSIANPQLSLSGPVPVTLTPGASETELSATLTAEGAYTFAASAVGPDGQAYSDTVIITVISKTKLETLLQSKWDGIKSKLSQADVEGAVPYFISPLQQDYRETFIELGTSLPLLSDELQPIDLAYATDDVARCRFVRTEDVLGQMQQIEYVVYYLKENGIWKLRDF